MRKAHVIVAVACLAASPGALAQPGEDLTQALQAEAMADTSLRRQAQGEAGPRLYGGIQLWYLSSLRNDAFEDEDNFTHSFVTRRVKLGVEKTTGDLRYQVQGFFSRGSDFFFLEDAWAGAPAGDFLIRAGQFKPPFVYEENVLWHDQLAAERSYTADFFSQGYTQGIEFQYDPLSNYRVKFAAGDGIRTQNLDFDALGEADYGFTGRVDFLARGDWDTVKDFTSEFGGPEALRFGIAGHHQVAGRTGGRASRVDVWAATADAQWERNGLSLFGSATVLQANAKDAGFDLVDLGFVGQVGYRYSERNEVFGRVDAVLPDPRPDFADDDQIVFTVGYNHYIAGPSARFTADLMYFTTATDNTLIRGDTGQGFLRDEGAPQFVMRLAFQFLF